MAFDLLDTFGLVDKSVQLGVSPQMGKDKRHGVVHYDTREGTRHIGFLADHPNKITNDDQDVVKHMFRQLDLIGLPATVIEVKRGRSIQLIKRSSGDYAAARLRAL